MTNRRNYYQEVRVVKGGITPAQRIWANSLGLRYDPWVSCVNWCTYCFARNMQECISNMGGKKFNARLARVGDINQVIKDFEKVFVHGNYDPNEYKYWAMKNKYFMEVGTMGEPMQEADEEFGVMAGLLNVLNAYQYPLYLNTKTNLLGSNESYYKALVDLPVKIVDVSLAGIHDDLLHKFEPNAPLASERLKVIKRLVKDNVPVVVSCRPILKGVTDKDLDLYIKTLTDIGVKSIHLRSIVLITKQVTRKIWQDFIKEHGMEYKTGEYRYPSSYFMDLANRAQELCKGTGTTIVGTRNHWFELGGNHGKCRYDDMPAGYQEHLIPWSIVPLLREVRKDADKPQLLKWGWKTFANNMPDPSQMFYVGGVSNTSNLVRNQCCMMRHKRTYLVSLPDFVRNGIWNGFGTGKKSRRVKTSALMGDILRVKNILPVMDKEFNPVKDANDNYLLAYVPTAMLAQYKNEEGGIDVSLASGFMEKVL